MPRRQPLPRTWMLTDERQGNNVARCLRRLPPSSGLIVRHYSLPPYARERLCRRLARLARARGQIVLFASRDCVAPDLADGAYREGRRRLAEAGLVLACPAHDLAEIRSAERRRADFILLSPLFATRSHPGAPALGVLRFAALARSTRLPVVALGGVTQRHARVVRQLGAWGWSGIDAFGGRRPASGWRSAERQKRKAVPI